MRNAAMSQEENASVAKVEDAGPSFLKVFGELEDGALDHDLTNDLIDLVHDMRAVALSTGIKPKATIALSLEIKLDGGVFEIVPHYKIKPPKKPRSRSIYYATKDGGLTVNNPAQHNLPLGGAKDVTS